MPNSWSDQEDILSPVSYEIIYKELGKAIEQFLFKNGENTIYASNLVSFCLEQMLKLSRQLSERFLEPFQMNETAIGGNFVTLNLANPDREQKMLQQLREQIGKKLQELGVDFKTTPLKQMTKLDLSSPFHLSGKPKKISLGTLSYSYEIEKPLLSYDDLQIQFPSPHRLQEEIQDSLIQYIKQHKGLSDIEKEESIELIQQHNRWGEDIQKFLNENRFGAIKRCARFLYLDYLLEEYEQNQHSRRAFPHQLLRNYVQRHELFEKTCNQLVLDGVYAPIHLLNKECDFFNSVRHEDVFSHLPFIGQLTTFKSATEQEENLVEQYGLSMKFNGVVRKTKEKSFQYYLRKWRELADQGHAEDFFPSDDKMRNQFWRSYWQLVVFKFFLLHLDQETYDPLPEFHSDLQALCSLDGALSQPEVHAWFQKRVDHFFDRYAEQIEKLPHQLKTMEECLQKIVYSGRQYSKEYTRYLTFFKSMVNEGAFTLGDENLFRYPLDKQNYKFTMLTPELLYEESLFSFPYRLTFTKNFVFSEEQSNPSLSLEMWNHLCENDQTLPVFFLPVTNKKPEKPTENAKKMLDSLGAVPKLCFPYPYELFADESKHPLSRYLFQLIYRLVVNLCVIAYIDQLTIKEPKRLFVNFWRLQEFHAEDYTTMERFVRQLSKEFEFLLSLKYGAGSQGFVMGDNKKYKEWNTSWSMYAPICKAFRLSQPIRIPKIAIISITSMNTDTPRNGEKPCITGIFGDVYGVYSEGNHSYVKRLNTFFDHQKDKVFQQLPHLADVMFELQQKGFQHVLFVARPPYRSPFLTKGNGEKELYFMNEELLTSFLKEGFHIYPIHCHVQKVLDYRSEKQKEDGPQGFYIEDTRMLKQVYQDHVGLIPILQFYSGEAIKTKENFYHSLITYQTWKEMYDHEELNQTIQNGLLYPHGIKGDLMRALLLFHVVHYERSKGQSSIKVDPYKDLMGDEGIAKRSVVSVNHPQNQFYFKTHPLAYLAYLHSKVFDGQEIGS
jgi:hypothetical protein